MDYEAVLERIGGCGRFQLTAFAVLSICTFKVALDIQLLLFVTYTPDFVCASALTNETCRIPDLNNGTTGRLCNHWNYSDEVLSGTMVTDMDLVCDRKHYAILIQTLTFAGAILGMVVGVLGDIVGRRRLLLIQAVWDTIFSILIAVVPGLQLQLVLRFIRGLSSGIYYQGAAYITEIVSVKYRMNLGCNYWLMWCFGYAACAGFGKWLQEWRLLQGVSAALTAVYLSYFFILPESPRWLILKGRNAEAANIFANIARWNGKQIPPKYLENITVGKEPEGTLFDLFRSKQMCLKTVSSWLLLWSFGCSYMAISLHSTFASDDIFINMALMGIVEIPSSPFAWLLSDKIGRRKSIAILNIVAAVCVMSVPFLNHVTWARISIAILGKFILTASYCVGDVWVAECFPTCIRNLGLFTSAMFSSIAFMIAPMILTIKEPVAWMPEAIVAAQTLLALLVLLVLPETMGAPLLQTVEEADLFVRGKEHEIKSRLMQRRGTYDIPVLETNMNDTSELQLQLSNSDQHNNKD